LLNIKYIIVISDKLLNRITLNSKVSFGKPTVRNLRYSVVFILDLLASGMTNKEILSDYIDLEEEDILACLHFASKLMKVDSVKKIVAA